LKKSIVKKVLNLKLCKTLCNFSYKMNKDEKIYSILVVEDNLTDAAMD
jgi:hypothetical protein